MRGVNLKLLKDDIREHLYDIEERFCVLRHKTKHIKTRTVDYKV